MKAMVIEVGTLGLKIGNLDEHADKLKKMEEFAGKMIQMLLDNKGEMPGQQLYKNLLDMTGCVKCTTELILSATLNKLIDMTAECYVLTDHARKIYQLKNEPKKDNSAAIDDMVKKLGDANGRMYGPAFFGMFENGLPVALAAKRAGLMAHEGKEIILTPAGIDRYVQMASAPSN